MIELKAKAMKARKDSAIDALAISVNASFPQFDAQSSTLVAEEDDADIIRYASICTGMRTKDYHQSIYTHRTVARLIKPDMMIYI